MKNIFLLGATGSIGSQTLDIIRLNKDKFNLVGCSCGFDKQEVIDIIYEFKPQIVSMISDKYMDELQTTFKDVVFCHGDEGLIKIATYKPELKGILVNSVVGSVGLVPTVEAIKVKRDLAIANKETLVAAGSIVTKLVKEYGVNMLPIDSEHSAILQCLNGERNNKISKIIITASGGSFRDKNREELVGVTVDDALNHPNWSMGAKITIDSATMFNKGLEVIEAAWLFDLSYDKIETILHNESVIHSMVEFEDGAVMAQLGTPDMRIPIQYALSFPERLEFDSKKLNLAEIGKLHFKEMDEQRFPAIQMAYSVGRRGGNAPCILNAANEAAVSLFLDGKIEFLDIEYIVCKMINSFEFIEDPTLDDILNTDKEVKSIVYDTFGGE